MSRVVAHRIENVQVQSEQGEKNLAPGEKKNERIYKASLEKRTKRDQKNAGKNERGKKADRVWLLLVVVVDSLSMRNGEEGIQAQCMCDQQERGVGGAGPRHASLTSLYILCLGPSSLPQISKTNARQSSVSWFSLFDTT